MEIYKISKRFKSSSQTTEMINEAGDVSRELTDMLFKQFSKKKDEVIKEVFFNKTGMDIESLLEDTKEIAKFTRHISGTEEVLMYEDKRIITFINKFPSFDAFNEDKAFKIKVEQSYYI